jgi:hypothetical protein
MAQCSAFKPDGTQCRVTAMRDSTYCWNHDPSFAAQRRRNTARGGRAGGRGRKPSEIAQIKDKLRKIAEDVLDPKAKVMRGDAAVAVQAYTAIMNCIRTELKQREQEELIERMEALEDALKARREGSGYYA